MVVSIEMKLHHRVRMLFKIPPGAKPLSGVSTGTKLLAISSRYFLRQLGMERLWCMQLFQEVAGLNARTRVFIQQYTIISRRKKRVKPTTPRPWLEFKKLTCIQS